MKDGQQAKALNKSAIQKIIEFGGMSIVAILGIYAAIDGFSSAIDFITYKIAIYSTVIIITIWSVIYLFFKNKNQEWIEGEKRFKIVKPKTKFHIITLASIFAIWLPLCLKSGTPKADEKICDRDVENGCTIDLPDALNWRMDLGEFGGAIQYTVSVGKNQTVELLQFVDSKQIKNIPKYRDFPKEDCPYQISCDADNLFFSGYVREFKNNELIGWFDKNDFGSYDCKMIWNKDEYGLEILDKYSYVVFSINHNPLTEKMEFKGYYRDGDMIHIFNEEWLGTQDIKHAERLISQIKPIFKHRGNNSTGVRLIEQSTRK